MMSNDNSMIMSLLPFFLISIPFAILHYFLARRLGKSPVLWLILSFIPLFNFFFITYALYRAIFTILDRLDKVSPREQS